MPEAGEVAAVPPSPPIEPGSSSSRASFASCPPEEGREARVSRRSGEEEVDGERDVRQEPTPEPESPIRRNGEEADGDGVVKEEAVRGGDGDAVTSAENGSGERRAVESPGVAVGGEIGGEKSRSARIPAPTETETEGKGGGGEETGPLYLRYPDLPREKLHPQAWCSFLHPGSKFRGTQQSDRQVYDVQVEIKDVDLTESRLCGYLRIQGLTDDHPTLTTFFHGDIIGPHHTFRTTHPAYQTTEKIDLTHWSRFPAFRPLARAARASPAYTLDADFLEREHLFMRWKESFLVPDHTVKSISGASFEGFYYICFDQVGGGVSGIYFHAKSEKYQRLELRWVGDAGCVGAVEFR